MTVEQLRKALEGQPPHRRVVVSNVLHSPWAVVSIKEVQTTNELYPDGPIHLVAKDQ